MSETLTEEQVMQFVQPFIAQYQAAVAFAVIGVIAAVAVAICWWAYEKYFTPLESHQIRKAFRKHLAIMALGGDDGYLDICSAPTSGPEGFLESQPKGATKEHYSGALPRSKVFTDDDIQLSDIDPTKPASIQKSKYDLKKTVAVANYISMLASRRLLLRGAKVPVWLAYRGKAIMTSLYGLAALQLVETLCNLKKEAQGNEALKSIADAFAVVDLLAVKDLFSQQWNESQLNAQEADKERKGELKAKKFAGKESLVLIFALLIVVVIVAILFIVTAWYLGGGGNAQQAQAPVQAVLGLIR